MENRVLILPDDIACALDMLKAAGYEAYTVGGCVRDFFAGREIHDWDITTSALPEQTMEVFGGYRLVTDGLKHGTVCPIINGKCVEITTFRKEGKYSDGRHPDSVIFTPSLTEDLARRDFTMNAIAYGNGSFTDPFGGIADIQNRIIRCVGNAEKRFSEDALRILRAVRFAAQLGFYVDISAVEAAEKCAPMLAGISAERIFTEIKKTVCGSYAAEALELFAGLIRTLFRDFVPENIPLLKNAPCDFPLRWALLFDGKNAALSALHGLKPDRDTLNTVRIIIENGDIDTGRTGRTEMKYLLRDFGVMNAKRIILYAGIKNGITDTEALTETLDGIISDGECFSLKDLAIKGSDLIGFGISGTDIGRILGMLLDAVIKGEIPNETDKLKQKIRQDIL